MADKQTNIDNVITRTQECWQELERGIDDHAKLLTQLSQIAKKFQSVDFVFSDFKQTQLEIHSLKEKLPQYSQNLMELQKTVDSMQQEYSENYHSLRNARSHIKQLRNLALIAILLGFISLTCSIVNFLQG